MNPRTSQPSVNTIGPATAPSATQLAARDSGFRLASVSIGCLRSVAIGVSSLLRQAHLQTDPFRADCARLKWALGGEALELARRVGAALEHLERRLRREGAH